MVTEGEELRWERWKGRKGKSKENKGDKRRREGAEKSEQEEGGAQEVDSPVRLICSVLGGHMR